VKFVVCFSMRKPIAYAFVLALAFVPCTNAQAARVLSVCDLIRNPDKWERQIVAVKGVIDITSSREPATNGIDLRPLPTERCSYSDSKYISADEPPEIALEYPDGDFLNSHRPAFSFRESSLVWAGERLRQIQKQHPTAQQAIVTVEADSRNKRGVTVAQAPR